MAWIKRTKRKDGSVIFWVHDFRDGRQVTIAECHSEGEAQMRKERYEIRRDLEKEGYDDSFGAQ